MAWQRASGQSAGERNVGGSCAPKWAHSWARPRQNGQLPARRRRAQPTPLRPHSQQQAPPPLPTLLARPRRGGAAVAGAVRRDVEAPYGVPGHGCVPGLRVSQLGLRPGQLLGQLRVGLGEGGAQGRHLRAAAAEGGLGRQPAGGLGSRVSVCAGRGSCSVGGGGHSARAAAGWGVKAGVGSARWAGALGGGGEGTRT
jgi:hypothetical protein